MEGYTTTCKQTSSSRSPTVHHPASSAVDYTGSNDTLNASQRKSGWSVDNPIALNDIHLQDESFNDKTRMAGEEGRLRSSVPRSSTDNKPAEPNNQQEQEQEQEQEQHQYFSPSVPDTSTAARPPSSCFMQPSPVSKSTYTGPKYPPIARQLYRTDFHVCLLQPRTTISLTKAPLSFMPNRRTLPQSMPTSGSALTLPAAAHKRVFHLNLNTNPNFTIIQLETIKVKLQSRILDTQQRIISILSLPPNSQAVQHALYKTRRRRDGYKRQVWRLFFFPRPALLLRPVKIMDRHAPRTLALPSLELILIRESLANIAGKMLLLILTAYWSRFVLYK